MQRHCHAWLICCNYQRYLLYCLPANVAFGDFTLHTRTRRKWKASLVNGILFFTRLQIWDWRDRLLWPCKQDMDGFVGMAALCFLTLICINSGSGIANYFPHKNAIEIGYSQQREHTSIALHYACFSSHDTLASEKEVQDDPDLKLLGSMGNRRII